MSALKRLARRYARWRDDTDPYLMAATLALAGEPDLARDILVERDEGGSLGGAGDDGESGRRIPIARATLAAESAS